jgi:hypothetical protein
MTDTKDAPITDPLIEFGTQTIDDKSNAFGKPRLSWILFFNRLLQGDIGQAFAPVFSGLTVVGTPTITGIYFSNQGFTDFFVRIVPSTSTTATTGTTYFTLPFDVTIDGACFSLSGLQGTASGFVDYLTNRCYPVGWSAVTVPLTIYGRVKTS